MSTREHGAECPHCQFVDHDAADMRPIDGKERAVECPACNSEYMLLMECRVTYSTRANRACQEGGGE